jgi:hypothetical protein
LEIISMEVAMIKKFTIAATVAASAVLGAPAANAGSPGACMAKYEGDLVACGADTACQMWADVMFNQCIQGLNDTIDPDIG